MQWMPGGGMVHMPMLILQLFGTSAHLSRFST